MTPFLIGAKPIEILLVEDNADEAELTREALSDGRVRNRIHWVEDGETPAFYAARAGAAAPAG
jgi:CheY-like chemotaxis protein